MLQVESACADLQSCALIQPLGLAGPQSTAVMCSAGEEAAAGHAGEEAIAGSYALQLTDSYVEVRWGLRGPLCVFSLCVSSASAFIGSSVCSYLLCVAACGLGIPLTFYGLCLKQPSPCLCIVHC